MGLNFFMKRRLVNIVLLVFFQIGYTYSQYSNGDPDGSALTDNRLQVTFAKLVNKTGVKNLNYLDKSVKGSPYLSNGFVKGRILQKDKIISEKFYFRYNGYADEIEIGTHPNQKEVKEAVLKKNDIVCEFGNQTYYYLPYKDKHSKLRLGYLISLFESNEIHLLVQLKKVYREATVPRTSLERAFPPRFTEEENYYLSFKNQTPVFLGNDIKKVIKNLPSEIKTKAKSKGSNFKKIKTIESLKAALSAL